MPLATLTSKGRITLPLAVRTALGLSAGHKVDFVAQQDGCFMVLPVRSSAASLKGRFAGRVKKPVSIEAMDDAVAVGSNARFVKGT
jgi:AbrB family looped-hinge helix DNA binding protein